MTIEVAVIGALDTAASLGEMASMYPTAGGEYHFTAQLAPRRCRDFLSWSVGWISHLWMDHLRCQCSVSRGTMIQGLLVLNHGSLIYWALVCLATVMNIWGRRLLSLVEGLSLVVHVVAFVANLVVILICSPAKHPAAFVFTHSENGSGWSNNGVAWSVGMLSSCYVLTGYDGAIHLGDEMATPETSVLYCMLGSIILNGAVGFGFLLAILFCMGDMQAALNSATGFPIIEIFRGITGSAAESTAMTSTLILTAWLATIALLASASPMLWSLARDKAIYGSSMDELSASHRELTKSSAIPRHRYCSHLDKRAGVPKRATLVTSAVLILLGLINIASTTAFNAVLSLAVLGLHVSYLVPVALMLWRRRRSSADMAFRYGPWRLGRCSGTVNIVAVVYLVYTSVFMVFPPYQPVTALNMNFAPDIFGAVLVFSSVYWVWKGGQYEGPHVH